MIDSAYTAISGEMELQEVKTKNQLFQPHGQTYTHTLLVRQKPHVSSHLTRPDSSHSKWLPGSNVKGQISSSCHCWKQYSSSLPPSSQHGNSCWPIPSVISTTLNYETFRDLAQFSYCSGQLVVSKRWGINLFPRSPLGFHHMQHINRVSSQKVGGKIHLVTLGTLLATAYSRQDLSAPIETLYF